jgi:hypothetical protein
MTSPETEGGRTNMATLFDQPPRQQSLESYVSLIETIALRFGFFPKKMSPAEWHVVCDLVRTALAIQSADVLDEQLGGFGDILRDAVTAISNGFSCDEQRTDHPLMGQTFEEVSGALNKIAEAIQEHSSK